MRRVMGRDDGIVWAGDVGDGWGKVAWAVGPVLRKQYE